MFALCPALIYKERGGERTHLHDDLLVSGRRNWRKEHVYVISFNLGEK
jgi:hypothetical protein